MTELPISFNGRVYYRGVEWPSYYALCQHVPDVRRARIIEICMKLWRAWMDEPFPRRARPPVQMKVTMDPARLPK